MSFELNISISNLTEDEAKALIEKHGFHTQIYGKWSYAGTMVPCEDFDDFHKLETDEKYAEERIIQTNTVM